MTPLTEEQYNASMKENEKTVGIINYKDKEKSCSQCFKIEVTKASYEVNIELCPTKKAEAVLESFTKPLDITSEANIELCPTKKVEAVLESLTNPLNIQV